MKLLGATLLCSLFLNTELMAAAEDKSQASQLHHLFTSAQQVAADRAEASAPASAPSAVESWLHEHRAALAADLRRSPLTWVKVLPATCPVADCACTGLTAAAEIVLAEETCSSRSFSQDYASKLLIHEAVHHFGVTDEAFADSVAIDLFADATGESPQVTLTAEPGSSLKVTSVNTPLTATPGRTESHLMMEASTRFGDTQRLGTGTELGISIGLGMNRQQHVFLASYRQAKTEYSRSIEWANVQTQADEQLALRTYGFEYRFQPAVAEWWRPMFGLGIARTVATSFDGYNGSDSAESWATTFYQADVAAGAQLTISPRVALAALALWSSPITQPSRHDVGGNLILPRTAVQTSVVCWF